MKKSILNMINMSEEQARLDEIILSGKLVNTDLQNKLEDSFNMKKFEIEQFNGIQENYREVPTYLVFTDKLGKYGHKDSTKMYHVEDLDECKLLSYNIAANIKNNLLYKPRGFSKLPNSYERLSLDGQLMVYDSIKRGDDLLTRAEALK